MKTESISYTTLAERVGDMVLFNEHAKFNEFWFNGIYDGTPLRERHNEAIDNDNTEGMTNEEREEYFDTHGHYTALDTDIYQTYHITAQGAQYLLNHTAEIVSYDEEQEAFLWHITHWGTSWSGVHTTLYTFDDEPEHEYIDINKADKYMIG
jgi:hypothetical protein